MLPPPVVRFALAAVFACQFVILDRVLGGAPRLAWVSSLALWALMAGVARPRAARIVAAGFASLLLVTQVYVFRFYHVPLDVQVAASALHAWRDIRGVLVGALPQVALAVSLLGAAEYALLAFVHRRPTPASSRAFQRLGAPALGCVALAGVFVDAPRRATPDIRALHSLLAFQDAREPHVAGRVELQPLHGDRSRLPHVMVILSESIRAEDYGPSTAPLVHALPDRIDLHQMRSVASYTAVSFSAVMTGRSQEGPREDIVRSPTLLDYAHATKLTTIYLSAQSEEVFEDKSMRAHVDDFTSVETLYGKEPEDDRGADANLVDRMGDRLKAHEGPLFVFVQLTDTHAPYFVEEEHAPFQPYDHVTAWSKMNELHNAYKDAIYLQDRHLKRAIDAFVARAGKDPWLVFFTSDHGEAFSEHGAIHHGQSLYDEQVHVPAWVLSGNGALDAEQKAALADHADRFLTHLDILPTVLDVLGVYDVFGVDKSKLHGRSLLRRWEPRDAIPVTNCTPMFQCPLNTWGLYENDHKLQARIFDNSWTCTLVGPGPERSIGDPTCEHLRSESRRLFPLLPNGDPNR